MSEFEQKLAQLRQAVVSLQEQDAVRLKKHMEQRALQVFGQADIRKIKGLTEESIFGLDPVNFFVDNRLAYDILELVAMRDTKYRFRGIFNMTIANPDRVLLGGDQMDIYRGSNSPHRDKDGRITYLV